MSQLDGKIAVVAGGTGQVGEGIVKRLIQAGATVIVPVRSKNAANQLAGYLDSLPDKRLVLIDGDLSNAESAALFRNELLRKFSRIDLAVASLGGWWKGRKLHEVNLDDWESILSNNLTSHIIAGKTLLSILLQQHQGMYVMVNGAASETVVPGSAPISVVAAAQSMMARSFAMENHGEGVRVHSVVIQTPVITRQNAENAREGWVSAEQVGTFICDLFEEEGTAFRVTHYLPHKED